jgi:hypothetical protein
MMFEALEGRTNLSEPRQIFDPVHDFAGMHMIFIFAAKACLHHSVEGRFGIAPDPFRVFVMPHLFDMAIHALQKACQDIAVCQKPGFQLLLNADQRHAAFIHFGGFQRAEDGLSVCTAGGFLALLSPRGVEIPDDENAFAALCEQDGSGVSALLQQERFPRWLRSFKNVPSNSTWVLPGRRHDHVPALLR